MHVCITPCHISPFCSKPSQLSTVVPSSNNTQTSSPFALNNSPFSPHRNQFSLHQNLIPSIQSEPSPSQNQNTHDFSPTQIPSDPNTIDLGTVPNITQTPLTNAPHGTSPNYEATPVILSFCLSLL